MKYTLIALAAATLMTGAASAGQDTGKWHCVGLKANWNNAPQLQCPAAFMNDRQQPQIEVRVPTPPAPPPPDVVDIPE